MGHNRFSVCGDHAQRVLDTVVQIASSSGNQWFVVASYRMRRQIRSCEIRAGGYRGR
jgi:hypothetical protein